MKYNIDIEKTSMNYIPSKTVKSGSHGVDISDPQNPIWFGSNEWWGLTKESYKELNPSHLEDFNDLLALAVKDSKASNQTSK